MMKTKANEEDFYVNNVKPEIEAAIVTNHPSLYNYHYIDESLFSSLIDIHTFSML